MTHSGYTARMIRAPKNLPGSGFPHIVVPLDGLRLAILVVDQQFHTGATAEHFYWPTIARQEVSPRVSCSCE